jgi:hypothetical protein
MDRSRWWRFGKGLGLVLEDGRIGNQGFRDQGCCLGEVVELAAVFAG